MRLLTGGKDGSFNVKGAYLEVWADMIGSVGVIIGALAIKFTGWTWIDPIVAVAIGLWVLPGTWVLLRDTTNVLLEGVPRGARLRTFGRQSPPFRASRACTTCASGRCRTTTSAARCT
ncbi:cation diffusion facilitator family transporter [Sphingomonas desiccabilis]|nr:cation diffusion facilitator family transporter [Sphingomonas desiccabilis]